MGFGEKRQVYVLQSQSNPCRFYTGLTDDVNTRLWWHNHGSSGYTTRYRPWSALVTLEFSSERAARQFEAYLKTGSGRAFAKRHFAAESRPRQEETACPGDMGNRLPRR